MSTKKDNKAKKALKTLDITLPSGWGELTPQQVLRVAYFLSLKLDETRFLVEMAAEFADLKPRGSRVTDQGDITYNFYHRKQGNVSLTAEHVTAIAHALKWTLGEVAPMQAPVLNGYKTPDSDLYGVVLEQYMTAESACSAYIRTQDPEPLRVLAASLYPRREFNPESLQAEALRMRHFPIWQLQAVFLWFTGAKKVLVEKFPLIFSAEGSGEPLPGDEMLLGLLSSLNEGRVVDNDKLKRTDIYEIFYELNLKIKNSQKK